MKTFIALMFWIGLVDVPIRLLMLLSDYPRTATYSFGDDVVHLISAASILLWAALIKYGVLDQ